MRNRSASGAFLLWGGFVTILLVFGPGINWDKMTVCDILSLFGVTRCPVIRAI